MNTTTTSNLDQVTRLTDMFGEMKDFNLRFVLSFEKIAVALAEINETYKRQVAKQYPERAREVRDAVVSRVPTEEDRLREAHGASSKPISDWLSEDLDASEEEVGVREREWLQTHPDRRNAGPQGLG